MRFSEIKAKSEEMGVNLHFAVWTRLRYLRGLMIDEVHMMGYQLQLDNEFSDLFYLDSFDRFLKLAEEARSLALAANRKKPLPNEVTADMIEAAKNTDISTLIDFDRSGKALAFCHPDKHPSLSFNRKANRAHCFPCGKSFDPIAVLMERDGLTFFEAVRSLV